MVFPGFVQFFTVMSKHNMEEAINFIRTGEDGVW